MQTQAPRHTQSAARITRQRPGPGSSTEDERDVMRVTRTLPPIAADFLLTVPLFVSENPAGFHPNTYLLIKRTNYSITLSLNVTTHDSRRKRGSKTSIYRLRWHEAPVTSQRPRTRQEILFGIIKTLPGNRWKAPHWSGPDSRVLGVGSISVFAAAARSTGPIKDLQLTCKRVSP